MKKLLGTVLFALAVLVVAAPAWAKTYRIGIFYPTTINGTHIKAGDYNLRLNDSGQATLYQDGKMITKLEAKQEARTDKGPVEVVQRKDGTLEQIRLKDTVLVFTP
jgi:hypothetical protein